MTFTQINDAALAAKNESYSTDGANINHLVGLGTKNITEVYSDFKSIVLFIRLQCVQLNGDFDNEAMNEIAPHLKKKVKIAG